MDGRVTRRVSRTSGSVARTRPSLPGTSVARPSDNTVPLRRALVPDQTQEGLIDQRRGLKAMVPPFADHESLRDSMQLGLDARDQPVECPVVAAAPGNEQAREVGSCARNGQF